jgi:hypothetical protein
MIKQRLDGDPRTSKDGNTAHDLGGHLNDVGEFRAPWPSILLPPWGPAGTLALSCDAPRQPPARCFVSFSALLCDALGVAADENAYLFLRSAERAFSFVSNGLDHALSQADPRKQLGAPNFRLTTNDNELIVYR